MRFSSTLAFTALFLGATSMARPLGKAKPNVSDIHNIVHANWPAPPPLPPPPPPPQPSGAPSRSGRQRIGRRATKGQPRTGPRKVNMAGQPALDPDDIHDIVMAPWPSPPPQPPSRSGRKRIGRRATVKGQPRTGPRKVNMAGQPALDPDDIHDIVMAPWPSPPPQPPSRSGRKRVRRGD